MFSKYITLLIAGMNMYSHGKHNQGQHLLSTISKQPSKAYFQGVNRIIIAFEIENTKIYNHTVVTKRPTLG